MSAEGRLLCWRRSEFCCRRNAAFYLSSWKLKCWWGL